MLSSTSNSELVLPDVPRRPFLQLCAGSALATLGLLAGSELFWRRRGFRAEVRDAAELWCEARQQATLLGPSALAIVGSSRFQLGVDPQVLAKALPAWTPIQLAINGSPALPVLGDLAADPDFRGAVLCEVMPQNFFARNALRAEGVPWLVYARARPAAGPWEGRMRRLFQRHVASIQPTLDGRVLARRLLLGQGLPDPPYFHLRDDRFVEADYSRADTGRLLAQWVERAKARTTPPSEPQLVEVLARIAGWCAAIARRGGRVIFVRMVSSLEVREIEDAAFPRAGYWERLLQATGSAGVYDHDLPGARELSCPEGSHLDARQARSFTHALAEALADRRLI